MINHMHILLIARVKTPSEAADPACYYKVSHNTLYTTQEAEATRTWERPARTLSEESGAWLDFNTFSTPSCTITLQSSSEWRLAHNTSGRSVDLLQTWYWATPGFRTKQLDTTTGVGAELTKLWAEGKICFHSESGTLYCKERNQQFGVTNYQRLVKLDRGSSSWFVYDGERAEFRAITSLVDNEHFANLNVEELDLQMFRAAPSKAWQNFQGACWWTVSTAGQAAATMALSALVGIKMSKKK